MDFDKILRLTQELKEACNGEVTVSVPVHVGAKSDEPYIQIFSAFTPPTDPVFQGMVSRDTTPYWSGVKQYEKTVGGVRVVTYLTEEAAAVAGL